MAETLYKHPDYIENLENWTLYRDLFEGKHDVLTQDIYLWPHILESNSSDGAIKIKTLRKLRTRYLNVTEPVISRYRSLFFKNDLIIPEQINDLFPPDYDLSGTGDNLKTIFQEKALITYLIYGRVFIIADAFDHKPKNRGDDQNASPTLWVLDPLAVVDWEIETQDPKRKGDLKFIRVEYTITEPRASATEQPITNIYSREYRYSENIYTVTTWKKADKKANADKKDQWDLVDSIPLTGFDRIPVTYLFSESWIKDVAQETLRLFNFMSNRDNINYHQGYERTYFIGALNSAQEKAVAEYTAAVLPEGTTVQTLQASQPVALDLAIERSLNAIFRIAFNQNRTVSADSKAVESSDTQQESKEQLVSLVLSEIEQYEAFINDTVSNLMMFKVGTLEENPGIQVSRDIEDADISKQLELYSILRDEISAIPQWRAEILQKFLAYQDLDSNQEIIDQIKAIATQPRPTPVLDARQNIFNRLNNGNQTRNPENS